MPKGGGGGFERRPPSDFYPLKGVERSNSSNQGSHGKFRIKDRYHISTNYMAGCFKSKYTIKIRFLNYMTCIKPSFMSTSPSDLKINSFWATFELHFSIDMENLRLNCK